MDFETFKEQLIKKYEKLNITSPTEEDMLLMFLSIAVTFEYQEKAIRRQQGRVKFEQR